MLLAEAQSLCPSRVLWELHDPDADQRELRQLAHACSQFTPWVALEPRDFPEALALDTTGSDFNYGGELPLAQAVRQWFHRQGYHVALALADTWGAAWALAHQPRTEPILIVPSGQHIEALRPLPVESLRLSPDTVALLHQFDLRSIDQLLALPRADLPARFGDQLLPRLDQALGIIPELLSPEHAPEWVEAHRTCEPPLVDRQILHALLTHLLEQILRVIQSRPVGVQRLWCILTFPSGQTQHFPLVLSRPSRSLRAIADLLNLHLERLEVSEEITAVTVRVVRMGLLDHRQTQLFDSDPTEDEPAWQALWDQLRSRLGESAVLRPQLCPDFQPERAFTYETGERSPSMASLGEGCEGGPVRPIRLLPEPVPADVVSIVPGGPPRRFGWEQQWHETNRCWGPERIETGWWRGDDVRRDYYLVETTRGEWFWLFRTLADERWWLHGLFA